MKVIIADDHALFRDALSHYIERSELDSKVIQVNDFHGVMDILSTDDDVDLVLLDLRMPGMNGLSGIKKVRETWPNMPIVLLSGLAEKADVQKAMENGANGYFPKTLSGKVMLQGIHKILQGEQFMPMDYNTNTVMASHFNDHPSSTGEHALKSTVPAGQKIVLTPREREVLGYLLRGVSNKEIAIALNLQVVTVKLHVRGVCRKLGAKNRTQAALLAQQMGFE